MLAPMLVQMERQIDREIAADNKANGGVALGTQTDNDLSQSISVGTEDLFDTDSDDEDDNNEPVLMYGPQPQIITNDLKSLDEMVSSFNRYIHKYCYQTGHMGISQIPWQIPSSEQCITDVHMKEIDFHSALFYLNENRRTNLQIFIAHDYKRFLLLIECVNGHHLHMINCWRWLFMLRATTQFHLLLNVISLKLHFARWQNSYLSYNIQYY